MRALRRRVLSLIPRLAGHSGLLYVNEEELAQGSGGQAGLLEVGVVEIGASEVSELLGDVFVLAGR